MDRQSSGREMVYRYIVDYKRDHDGLAPSVRELAKALSMHKSTVQYHLLRLENDGRIRILGRRAIEVIGGQWNLPGA